MYAFAAGLGSDFNVTIKKKQITLKTKKISSRELVIFWQRQCSLIHSHMWLTDPRACVTAEPIFIL